MPCCTSDTCAAGHCRDAECDWPVDWTAQTCTERDIRYLHLKGELTNIFSHFFFLKPAFSVLSSFISKSHRWRISGYIQEQVSLKNRTFVTAWTHLRTDLLPQRSHT